MSHSTAPRRSEGPRVRPLAVIVAALTALLLLVPLAPGGRLFKPLAYLPLHTALEFAAMAVSVMVFALSWNLRRQPHNSHLVLLGAAFLSVGLIDFGHALTYPAMPDMLGHSGPQLTLDFWLAGRAIAALGLFAVAVLPVRSWPPAAAGAAAAGAVALSALVWWLSLVHGDWLPPTVTPTGDLTGFKVGTEYTLSATYFLAALLMLRRRGDWAGANRHFLAAGAWVLGLGELLFTLYVHAGDVVNFTGHLYKAMAYVMLYRGLFVAGVIAPYRALERKEVEIAHQARHDALTGLPNRLAIEALIAAAIQPAAGSQTPGALLLLDLDQFKNVNDSLGHAVGDELLRLVAARLAGALAPGDALARMGGDEFAVLATGHADPDAAGALAQTLIDALRGAFVLSGGQELHIGTSIGICLFPRDAGSVDQVIRNADAALYEAKRRDVGGFRFYDRALTDLVNDRVEMERRLRRGLERREFALHYQPLVRAADGRITGVEALLRWAPADAATVPAATFIKVAEDTGLIIPLGQWALRTACAQMKAWRDQGLALDVMAVNLSPQQFRQPGVAAAIAGVLDATGLPPAALELEITESSLIGAEIETTLRALKDLGVQLAIDDFGTGYSSLAYLKRFPVDKVKIDRSFVRDLPDDAKAMEIAAAVVALGKALGLEVLAEGVETEGQLARLRALGCTTLQGYLVGRPMPADDLARLLRGEDTAALQRLQLFAAPAAATEPATARGLSVA